jgi:hypothetical protein
MRLQEEFQRAFRHSWECVCSTVVTSTNQEAVVSQMCLKTIDDALLSDKKCNLFVVHFGPGSISSRVVTRRFSDPERFQRNNWFETGTYR